MALTTFSMIFLGNSVDLDPVEGNSDAENAAGLIDTYYGPGDPAHQHITTVTSDDANNDAAIAGDGAGSGETVTYDIGSGTVTTVLDLAATVNVTISFTPGSGEPDYVGIGGIIQTAEGDLFLVMIDDDIGLGANALDNFPVVSVEVTSIVSAGQNQNAAASDDQEFVTCFVKGTEVLTNVGSIAVEHLKIGDLMQTNNGLQPVRWIARTKIQKSKIENNPRLRPVCISKGALGDNLPLRDLYVSRQHKMRVSSKVVQRMFDVSWVFVTAIQLTALPGIFVEKKARTIEYFHILLDDHEIIFAEGAPTESFYAGPLAMTALSPEAKQELETVFPDLLLSDFKKQDSSFFPDNKLQRQLVARHVKNQKKLIDSEWI
ncbi:MAG: Hint domain-containing protein [Paracoccaceae bacterium]